ncbi:MAG TPA: hypothetical protein VJ744_06920 [Gaiellaceae bacterium]|nr:hypothetical protein [Gaiellaceae bacterium]
MTRTRMELDALRDRALALAPELGLDPNAWYLRVLAATRVAGEPADLGALVRAYWELQRVTGRIDLRDDWRGLADAFWEIDAA